MYRGQNETDFLVNVRGETMNRRFLILAFATLTSMATACSRKLTTFSNYTDSGSAGYGGGASYVTLALAASPQRYIAERHKLEIITAESDLQKSWESTDAYCGTIQCE